CAARPTGRKLRPDIKEQDPFFPPRLPRPQRLGACRIPEHFEIAQFLAQQMRVQQGRKFSSQFASTLVSTRRGKKMTEVQQQAQGIKLRQTAARIGPFFYEFRALRRGRKKARNS